MFLCLGIPDILVGKIFKQTEEVTQKTEEDTHETVEAQTKAALLYFLENVPMASWQLIAGALFFVKEEKALEEVKKNFLKHTPGQYILLSATFVADLSCKRQSKPAVGLVRIV